MEFAMKTVVREPDLGDIDQPVGVDQELTRPGDDEVPLGIVEQGDVRITVGTPYKWILLNEQEHTGGVREKRRRQISDGGNSSKKTEEQP